MAYLNDVAQLDHQTGAQILIMEDEVNVGKGLELVLSEEGYGVDLVQSGKSAIETFSQKPFDLLVADLRLPDINGMDVIKRLKQERPDTGVIVITGYSTISSAVEATKLGASDYLSKPFTSDEFVTAVNKALSEHKKLLDKIRLPEAIPEPEEPVLEPTPEDLRKVSEILLRFNETFSGKREEVIPMLQRIQNHLGYIPSQAIEEIAAYTRTSPASVYGIATFYEQFRLKPVGKHIIKVCRGTACHVKGADRILNELATHFQITPGKTSTDRMFTLETVACFGSCAIAPVVLIDDEVKAKMTPVQTRNSMDHLRQDKEDPTIN